MSVPSSVIDICAEVRRELRDTGFSAFDQEADIYACLRRHATNLNGVPIRRDVTRKIFEPDSSVYWQIRWLGTDAVLNTAQDQTGTLKTANAVDYLQPRFTFTAAQDDYVVYYLFGTAYNVYLATADLLDRHPTADDTSQLQSLSILNYSVAFARRGTLAESYRKRGAFINRPMAGHLGESIVDPYRRLG